MISFLAMCMYSKKFLELPNVTDEEFAPVTPEPNVKDEDAPVPGK